MFLQMTLEVNLTTPGGPNDYIYLNDSKRNAVRISVIAFILQENLD